MVVRCLTLNKNYKNSLIEVQISVFIVIRVLLFLLQVCAADNMDAKAVSSTIANFAAKFCNELDKSNNVVCSPLSAEYLLALVALGADEPSRSELFTAFGFQDKEAIRSAFSSVSSKLRSVKGVTLNVANQVYVKEGPYQLEPGLLQDATNVFDAAIEKMDFTQSAAAANTINKWVEEKTNNKIRDLLSPDSFNDYTRMVLVNALYFKGSWKDQFKKFRTRERDFHVDAKTTVQVAMMSQMEYYRYGESEELGVQLLEMPYVGDEASMVIILPKEIEGLNAVMQKLADGYDLMGELEKMYRTKVDLSLPKFKIETEIDLTSLLPKIGIKSIFNKDNSGLNNLLSPPEELYVSKAVQKAFIEVNEEGSEAAVATAEMVQVLLCRPRCVYFHANRPFIAIIFIATMPSLITTVRRSKIKPGDIKPRRFANRAERMRYMEKRRLEEAARAQQMDASGCPVENGKREKAEPQ